LLRYLTFARCSALTLFVARFRAADHSDDAAALDDLAAAADLLD